MIRAMLLSLCLLAPALANATDSACAAARTQDQQRNEDTIRRIERGWLTAEFHGDTVFLDCLLTSGYRVIVTRDNTVKTKSDLIARVAKKAGQTTPVPPLETTVAINGDFATALSVMHGKKANGESYEARYVDSYVFRDGVWQATAGVDL